MKILALFLAAPLAWSIGCGDSSSTPKDAAVQIDAPVIDAPGTMADASCFTNPTTNEEILNACTTAQKIYKDSHPPLLNADGSLPPLP